MAPVNGYWKWIAAILVTIMLAGAPGYINLYVDRPSQRDFDVVQERQNNVLIRLSVLESQIQANQVLLTEIQKDLREHEQASK